MKLLLVPNPTLDNALASIKMVVSILNETGAELLMSQEYQSYQLSSVTFCQTQQAWELCDLVITLGGDGTILRAAAKAIHHQKPVLGVNFGHLGYLTALEKDELHKLKSLLYGQYIIEKRSVLEYEIKSTNERGVALNDITFFKALPERTINVDIYCDRVKVSGFHGDGVIFATPTGSTAYSMSAGGPIVDGKLEGIIVTQICAHIVKTPSMVFSGERVLHVVSNCVQNQEVLFTCDGNTSCKLTKGAEALIFQSNKTMPLVQFQEANQLHAIDNKLKSR